MRSRPSYDYIALALLSLMPDTTFSARHKGPADTTMPAEMMSTLATQLCTFIQEVLHNSLLLFISPEYLCKAVVQPIAEVAGLVDCFHRMIRKALEDAEQGLPRPINARAEEFGFSGSNGDRPASQM